MSSGFGRVAAFFAMILIVIAAVVGVVWFSVPHYAEGGNQTGNETSTNQTMSGGDTTIVNQQITQIDNRGNRGFADVLFAIVMGLFILTALGFLLHYGLKFYRKKTAHTEKRKQRCEEEAFKELKERAYEVDFQKAKQSFPFFGADEDRNPAWLFIFLKAGTDPTLPLHAIHKSRLISCKVDATNLHVWDEDQGKDMDDLLEKMRDQRFGRHAVPNYPGKTEKEFEWPDFFGAEQPTLSIPFGGQEQHKEESR